jgi:TonB family protein
MKRCLVALALALGCGGGGGGAANPPAATPADPNAGRGFEPPAATNAESPVHYPARLYDQTVEGTVVLRLYVDASGAVTPESTRVAEGSGYPALDSAAVAGVPAMTFVPARRNGVPVGASFLQPVYFRHMAQRGRGERP